MAQTAETNDIRPGFKVEVEGQPYTVISNEFVKPGKGRAFNRMKLKNVLNGKVLERTFTSGDRLELADVQESAMRLLYKEGTAAVFMDEATFEQVHISSEGVGDAALWIIEDMLCTVLLYRGAPVAVQPPTFVEMRIVETAPGVRGDTASGRVLKPAKLACGAEVQVPIFVEEGELIKVDTRTGSYVARVNG